ncbi:MAG: twitching motility protein PilT [Rhizobiales bacterium 17-65-6]|nr:MAG: twitching motility protein PilT [Rhizobiales bacterium 32-66-11]OYY86648.1 MAG: twitching motility protein PilT [Rhizobiales bacterium 35-66-30]OYZ89901.1 MAG: twitching motility protein PilT [Rhizobiales bacterium 17-65-6]OZB04186.1 MAG: twitching motility protein PilT [Rhizobiales bacterium 39-66-18]
MAEPHHSPTKEVRLFRNNRSQAVRIPVEFELPGDRALISREGDRIIIEPVRQSTGLLALLATWEPLDEDFPAIEDMPVEPEDIF